MFRSNTDPTPPHNFPDQLGFLVFSEELPSATCLACRLVSRDLANLEFEWWKGVKAAPQNNQCFVFPVCPPLKMNGCPMKKEKINSESTVFILYSLFFLGLFIVFGAEFSSPSLSESGAISDIQIPNHQTRWQTTIQGMSPFPRQLLWRGREGNTARKSDLVSRPWGVEKITANLIPKV